MTGGKVFTARDPWPDLNPGAVLALNYGDYRNQYLFVVSGADYGVLVQLGNGYGHRIQVADDDRTTMQQMSGEPWRQPPGTLPRHPHWEDVVALGPLTLLIPGDQDMYRQGWTDGRKRLVEQFESLADEENIAPQRAEPAALHPVTRRTGTTMPAWIPPQSAMNAVLSVLTRTAAARAKGKVESGIRSQLRSHHHEVLTAHISGHLEDLLAHMVSEGLLRRIEPATDTAGVRWIAVDNSGQGA